MRKAIKYKSNYYTFDNLNDKIYFEKLKGIDELSLLHN